jgi:hypothetical protein
VELFIQQLSVQGVLELVQGLHKEPLLLLQGQVFLFLLLVVVLAVLFKVQVVQADQAVGVVVDFLAHQLLVVPELAVKELLAALVFLLVTMLLVEVEEQQEVVVMLAQQTPVAVAQAQLLQLLVLL